MSIHISCLVFWIIVNFVVNLTCSYITDISYGVDVTYEPSKDSYIYNHQIYVSFHSLTYKPDEFHLVFYDDLANCFFIFFNGTSAMIVLRLLGKNVFTLILHAVVQLAVLLAMTKRVSEFVDCVVCTYNDIMELQTYVLIFVYSVQVRESPFYLNSMILLISIAQCLLAFVLFYIRPGLDDIQKTLYLHIHHVLGLSTIALLVWNYAIQVMMLTAYAGTIFSPENADDHNEFYPWPIMILSMVYLIFVMCLVLYPYRNNKRQYDVENVVETA